MLDDLGLVPAIEWLANDFTQRYGIAVEHGVQADGVEFSGAAATAIFRIVQEALTNVARHAQATRVVLTLGMDEVNCLLRVADDGRGAPDAAQLPGADGASPASPVHDKSFGLLGIRERAHMLGGAVAIDTASGRGFALTVTLPLAGLLPQEASS
jgi:signal transduction histidine kinase